MDILISVIVTKLIVSFKVKNKNNKILLINFRKIKFQAFINISFHLDQY